MIYVVPVVILVTFPLLCWAYGRLTRPCKPTRLDRQLALSLIEEATANVQPLPRAGRFAVDYPPPAPPFDLPDVLGRIDPYGPHPDTGPLLILSEKMAANDALEREIRERIRQAEQRIPERWR